MSIGKRRSRAVRGSGPPQPEAGSGISPVLTAVSDARSADKGRFRCIGQPAEAGVKTV